MQLSTATRVTRQASERESVMVGRISVLLVGIVAALIAGDPDSRVLGLVSNAWAGIYLVSRATFTAGEYRPLGAE